MLSYLTHNIYLAFFQKKAFKNQFTRKNVTQKLCLIEETICFSEWYSYHFPELIKIVPDNYTYVRTAEYIKNRKELTEDMREGLEEIVMDADKAEAIYAAAKMSMGQLG